VRPGTDPAVLSRRTLTREGLESRHEKAKFYFVLRGIRARVVWVVTEIPGDQEGLFKLAVQLRKFFNSVIYNTATEYVLLVYLTNI
jgi:hypothetical protein